jgi:hypothetical protein
MLYPAGAASVLWLQGNHTANFRHFTKWNEAKAALAKQAPERSRKGVATDQTASPKAQRVGHSARQMNLGEGSEWGVVKATTSPPTNPLPNLPPQSVTEVPEKPIVTATRETARPQKPKLKFTARSSGRYKKKAAASVKTAAATPIKPNLVVPTLSSTSSL